MGECTLRSGLYEDSLAHRLFHAASERCARFELFRNPFRNELCVHIGAFHFDNVDVDVAFGAEFLNFFLHCLDACALLADDGCGTTGVNVDGNLVGSAFDGDFRNRALVIIFLNEFTDVVVFDVS